MDNGNGGEYMEKTEHLLLKGTAQGVKMILNENSSIMEILEALHEKVRSSRNFFKGKCNVIICGRELSSSDKIRIISVMRTVLPEAEVIFGDVPHKNHTKAGERFIEKLAETAEESKQQLRPHRYEHTGEIKEIMPAKLNMRFYDSTVKNGEMLKVNGDVFIFGNVERDAFVYAVGSIYIFGTLEGSVYAGINGNDEAKVAAVVFRPKQLSISNATIDIGENMQENVPEIAILTNGTIFIDEFL